MLQRRTVLAATVAALASGSLGATLVYGGAEVPDPPQPVPPTDRAAAPGAERSLAARAFAGQGEVATLVYRNKDGQRCIAMGRPAGDKLLVTRRGSNREVPLADVGACNLKLEPVAVQIVQSREETIVFGLASPDVERVEVKAANGTLSTVPAADDGFIAASDRGLTGRATVVAHLHDGSTQVLDAGPLLDFDALTAGARANAPKPGEPQAPQVHGG